jgi:hypothetical protein
MIGHKLYMDITSPDFGQMGLGYNAEGYKRIFGISPTTPVLIGIEHLWGVDECEEIRNGRNYQE